MTIKAVLFGSIGTIIETSDIQRNCFNQAFQKANELMQMEAKPEGSKSNKKKSTLMIALMSLARKNYLMKTINGIAIP